MGAGGGRLVIAGGAAQIYNLLSRQWAGADCPGQTKYHSLAVFLPPPPITKCSPN